MSPRTLLLSALILLSACSAVSAGSIYTKTHSPALDIPDLNEVDSVLHIDDAITIDYLTLRIHRIDHTATGDLQIRLIAPDSSIALVFSQHDGLNDNIYEMWLDDRYPSELVGGVSPFTGVFKPYQSMSAFAGMSTEGDWTLRVLDNGGGDTGSIYAWSLAVNEPIPEPSTMAMLLMAAGGFVAVRLRRA